MNDKRSPNDPAKAQPSAPSLAARIRTWLRKLRLPREAEPRSPNDTTKG